MSWNQNRDANWRVPYTGGWCLKYVEDAFNTDHPFPSAIDAWNRNFNNGNHPGELPPAGKTVAVYFSLGNVPAGHVAISLDDGKVASSTQAGNHPVGYIHPNLQDLINLYGKYNGGCNYLGWSEYVGTVHVLQWHPDIVYATPDQIKQLYLQILERPADDGGIAHYQKYTVDFVKQDLLNSAEYKDLLAKKASEAESPQQTQPVPTPDPAPTPDPVPEVPTTDPSPDTPVSPTPSEPTSEPTPVIPQKKSPIAAVISWFIQLIKSIIRGDK